jgi:hypothetical protein
VYAAAPSAVDTCCSSCGCCCCCCCCCCWCFHNLQVQSDTPSQFTIPNEAPVTDLQLNIPTPSKQVNLAHTLQATYTCDGTATAGVLVTFTLKVAGTQNAGSPASVTCTTDSNGACSATVAGSATAVKYDVTASAPNCDSANNPGTTTATLKTGSGSTIEWTAAPAGPNGITLTVPNPTVNVGQTNEVQATLQCATPMPAGTLVSWPLCSFCCLFLCYAQRALL